MENFERKLYLWGEGPHKFPGAVALVPWCLWITKTGDALLKKWEKGGFGVSEDCSWSQHVGIYWASHNLNLRINDTSTSRLFVCAKELRDHADPNIVQAPDGSSFKLSLTVHPWNEKIVNMLHLPKGSKRILQIYNKFIVFIINNNSKVAIVGSRSSCWWVIKGLGHSLQGWQSFMSGNLTKTFQHFWGIFATWGRLGWCTQRDCDILFLI